MTMPTATPVAAKMTPERAAEIIRAAMEAQGITPQVGTSSEDLRPLATPTLGAGGIPRRDLGLNVGGGPTVGQQAGGGGNASPGATVDAILAGAGGPGKNTTPTEDELPPGIEIRGNTVFYRGEVVGIVTTDFYGDQNIKWLPSKLLPDFDDDAGPASPSATEIARLGLDRAKFAETQEQNLLANIMDALDIVRGSEAQQFQDIADVGPSLAGGREFFGGFGPEGGFTRLAGLQGADVGPISTEGNVVPITPAQTDPRIVQLLDALFGQLAQQGG